MSFKNRSISLKVLSAGFRVFILLLTSLNAFSGEFSDKSLEWQSSVPRFQDMELELETLASLASNKIVTLTYPEQDLKIDSIYGDQVSNKVRVVSAMTVINASYNKVKNLVKDYSRYTSIMPRTEQANILKEIEEHSLVEYALKFNLPVGAVRIKYLFQYTDEMNGDISVRLLDGAGEKGLSRWEFIPLPGNKTLLVFSNWSNLENSGYFFRSVVKAQPEMEIIIPIISSVIAVDSIQKQFTSRQHNSISSLEPFKSLSNEASLPALPKYNGSELNAIKSLAEYGMVMVLHPEAKFIRGSNSLKLKYISTFNKINKNLEIASDIVEQFDNYPGIFHQIKKFEYVKNDNGFETDWKLKLDFGFLFLSLDYSLEYVWLEKNNLYFFLTHGDIESIYGSLKWQAFDKQSRETLIHYTVAVDLGDELPFASKVLSLLPRPRLVSGIYMGTAIVDNQSRWLEGITVH